MGQLWASAKNGERRASEGSAQIRSAHWSTQETQSMGTQWGAQASPCCGNLLIKSDLGENIQDGLSFTQKLNQEKLLNFLAWIRPDLLLCKGVKDKLKMQNVGDQSDWLDVHLLQYQCRVDLTERCSISWSAHCARYSVHCCHTKNDWAPINKSYVKEMITRVKYWLCVPKVFALLCVSFMSEYLFSVGDWMTLLNKCLIRLLLLLVVSGTDFLTMYGASAQGSEVLHFFVWWLFYATVASSGKTSNIFKNAMNITLSFVNWNKSTG